MRDEWHVEVEYKGGHPWPWFATLHRNGRWVDSHVFSTAWGARRWARRRARRIVRNDRRGFTYEVRQ